MVWVCICDAVYVMECVCDVGVMQYTCVYDALYMMCVMCVCLMECVYVWCCVGCRMCVYVWCRVFVCGAECICLCMCVMQCMCVCDAVWVMLCVCAIESECVCWQREYPESPGSPLQQLILWSLHVHPLGFSRTSQPPREQHIFLRLPCLPKQACHSGSVSSATEAVNDVLITVLMQKQAFPACHLRGLSL